MKLRLPVSIKKSVLAFGGQTKNTVCFAKGCRAEISRIHPDLSVPEDCMNFEKDVKRFIAKNPKILAHDLHPEYSSTKYAIDLRTTNDERRTTNNGLRAIQHHHAHIASCMIENGLKNQKIIGVAFDGTGAGSDGHIWGAEFLVCDYKSSLRFAHLKEIPLVGGERVIYEPWRLVEAWLNFKYSPKGKILRKIYELGINSPLASSMGRLFDAAACPILGKSKAAFEAQLPIELEKVAIGHKVTKSQGHKVKILKDDRQYIIDPTPVLKGIVSDLKRGKPKAEVAYSFHLSVADLAVQVCLLARKQSGINKVCLSGGVFQNKLLSSLTLDLLNRNGFQVFTHRQLSCNDSSVSLGQAVIAGFGG